LSVVLSRLRMECVSRFNQAKHCVEDRLATGQLDFNLIRGVGAGLVIASKRSFFRTSRNSYELMRILRAQGVRGQEPFVSSPLTYDPDDWKKKMSFEDHLAIWVSFQKLIDGCLVDRGAAQVNSF
jgi:hypothetical protein